MRIYRSLFLLRILTAWTLTGLLLQLFTPITLYASNGGGPSTPEVSSFQAAGTGNMVDLATGDFSYNIPLMDIEGYPINLSYQSGISMEQQASMVGLGWNLNIGAVTRTMRGLPDDFKGDEVKQRYNMKPNQTWGISLGADFELFGNELTNLVQSAAGLSSNSESEDFTLGVSMGVFKNSYKGFGFELGLDPSYNMKKSSSTLLTADLGNKIPSIIGAIGNSSSNSVGTEINFNSQGALSLQPYYSFDVLSQFNGNESKNVNKKIYASYSTAAGLKNISIQNAYTDPKLSIKGRGMGQTLSSSTGISFASPSYVPRPTLPYINHSLTFNAKLGPNVIGTFPNARFGGYHTKQELLKKAENKPGYGILYAESATDRKIALLDFNREKDGVFVKNSTPYLPLTQHTSDIFSVSGQGVGGSYRAFRSEVGTVYDSYVFNPGASFSAAGEFGVGNFFHLSATPQVNITRSTTGKWQNRNKLSEAARFMGSEDLGDASFPEYESFYFKQVGEMSVNDQEYYDKIGNEDVLLPMLGNGVDPKANNEFENENGDFISHPHYRREKRAKRNQTFSFLAADKAKDFALDKEILSYKFNGTYQNDGSLDLDTEINGNRKRNFAFRKDHHISEINITRTDGSRYVYGLPAYNKIQKEVSFNSTGRTPNLTDYTTPYIPLEDITTENDNGNDGYFNETTLPPYSYAHHLTALLFPDYVDVTGDGISKDDLGNWVKFNYHKLYDNYRWRTPEDANRASYSPGLKSNPEDDKGSYIYGEKEIWIPHSIESRNFIAEFTYNDDNDPRTDANGVAGEHGGEDSNMELKKLVEIRLYSKREVRELGPNAAPIKTVHFTYNQKLCRDNLNDNSSGKLTLEELSFSYAKSQKGRETPYRFSYNENDLTHNPSYQLNHNDRWASYKPNDPGDLSNSDFPYTDQRPKNANNPHDRFADDYAQAWLLKEIQTPAGGKIKVSYESDDYAYVQDKKAMQMIRLRGFNDEASLSDISITNLFNGGGGLFPNFTHNKYVLFDLPYPVETDEEFKRYYLDGIKHLYFKILVNLNGKGDEEYVPGYAEIEDAGVLDEGDDKIGWIKLKGVGIKDNGEGEEVNPFAKAAWNYTRLNRPELIFPGSDPSTTGESAILGILGFAMQIRQMFQGANKMLRGRDFGKMVNAEESWIRLLAADGMKHGGGVRVNKVELTDNWNQMGGNGASMSTYGQSYSYTTQDEFGREISSGVAAYEPIIGGDENPFREPISYDKKNFLAPDENRYMEKPLGESFFPAPTVVYSKVQVRDLAPLGTDEPETGYTQHEFYTAKDYPTICKQTRLNPNLQIPGIIPSRFRLLPRELLTLTQGYVVKLNDMHGKPKATWTFAKGQEKPISGVEYFFRSKSNYNAQAKNELNNVEVTVIKPNGLKSQETIGKDIEMVLDSREHNLETIGYGANGNMDNFLLGFFPAFIPSIYPKVYYEQNRFRSMVATKVVNTYGILEKVVAHDQSSSVETENLAYDAETGAVLLTSTSNEFKDSIYNFTYPAHWAYEGMGLAYKNLGIKWTGKSFNDIFPDNLLRAGDELLVNDGGNWLKLWVMDAGNINGVIMGPDGFQYGNTYAFDEIYIVRSGRRNQQSASIGNIMSKTNPLDNGLAQIDEVLDASVVEFSEEWNAYCEKGCLEPGNVVNPYLKGLRGVWYPKRSLLYQIDRDYQPGTSRENGKFESFSPFWQPATPNWTANPDNWTWTEEVNKYSPFGYSLESEDALGRKSSSLYGYQNQLPIAVGVNAAFHQIANENFESMRIDADCQEPHLDLRTYLPTDKLEISGEEAHSGLFSLKLLPGKKIAAPHRLRLEDPPCTVPSLSSQTTVVNPDGSISVVQVDVVQAAFAYKLKYCDCIGGFSPEPGDSLLMSLWVKVPELCDNNEITQGHDLALKVEVDNQVIDPLPIEFGSPNQIIDGWQRIMLVYEIPPSANDNILISMENNSLYTSYVDDLRIQPFLSGMKTYVYNPYTLRLMAEGDDENYMTFYEYDEEGALIRVKKETERGIMTLQTNRNYTQQTQP